MKRFTQNVLITADNCDDSLIRYESDTPITIERIKRIIEAEDGPVNWDFWGITFVDEPRPIDLDDREELTKDRDANEYDAVLGQTPIRVGDEVFVNDPDIDDCEWPGIVRAIHFGLIQVEGEDGDYWEIDPKFVRKPLDDMDTIPL